jgi:sensor domain CHASE-containing protein
MCIARMGYIYYFYVSSPPFISCIFLYLWFYEIIVGYSVLLQRLLKIVVNYACKKCVEMQTNNTRNELEKHINYHSSLHYLWPL